MGVRFLKHIERTRLLLHLIDVAENTERDPVVDYRVILGELESFSSALAQKPMMVVASRVDAVGHGERLKALQKYCRRAGRFEKRGLGEARTNPPARACAGPDPCPSVIGLNRY